MTFLCWLESTSFSVWLRESPSVWAYPTVRFLHTLGLSFSVGPSLVMDLRLLGFASGVPLLPLERFFSVIWLGFWVSAVSGAGVLVADATTKLTNPVFYVKMIFIGIAMAIMVVMRRRIFRESDLDDRRLSGFGKLLAVASIACWLGGMTAGRFMAYFE